MQGLGKGVVLAVRPERGAAEIVGHIGMETVSAALEIGPPQRVRLLRIETGGGRAQLVRGCWLATTFDRSESHAGCGESVPQASLMRRSRRVVSGQQGSAPLRHGSGTTTALSCADGHTSWSVRGAGDRDRTGMASLEVRVSHRAPSCPHSSSRQRGPRQGDRLRPRENHPWVAVPEKDSRSSVGRP